MRGSSLGNPIPGNRDPATWDSGSLGHGCCHHSFLPESVAGYQRTGKEIPALQAMLLQCLVSSCHPQGEVRDGTVVLGEQPSPLSQPGFLIQLLQSWWCRVLGFLPRGVVVFDGMFAP